MLRAPPAQATHHGPVLRRFEPRVVSQQPILDAGQPALYDGELSGARKQRQGELVLMGELEH